MIRTGSGSRTGSFLLGVLGTLTVFAAYAQAQTFPSRPIEFVAHFITR